MGEFTDYIKDIYYDLSEYAFSEPCESPKVSVIIPCYNVEKYLDKCLTTLIKQTLKEIEIICINDGSEDFTSGILSAYSCVDKRIKVLEQTNQKQGTARNRGLDIAKGKYIISINAKKRFNKHYLERFYNAKFTEQNSEKNILVFNTACFGDVLLCNSLVQNIKKTYPKSKVIFICDKHWYDVAKNQEGVDEVVIYDKKGEHKGLLGMFKFVKNFKYKKPFASFITYKNERNLIVSKLLKSYFIISENNEFKENSKQLRHSMLLQKISNKHIQNLPIKFNVPENIMNKVDITKKYIVLCATSKKLIKDMPVKTAIELITKVNKETDYKVVFTGVGQKGADYSKELINAGCDFIDLVNKTSLLELAQVIKNAEALISVDTGTMHLGYALNTPTIAVFYEQNTVNIWGPNSKIYNVSVIETEQTSGNILSKLLNIITRKEVIYS